MNFQESTAILNACTKKSGNLLNAPHKLPAFKEKKKKKKETKTNLTKYKLNCSKLVTVSLCRGNCKS